MTNFDGWWSSLTEESRDKLMSDPFGEVPVELISSGGPLVVGAWWPTHEDGPSGFSYSWSVQRQIEFKRLRKVEQGLIDEKRALLEKYFPVGDGDGPMIVGEGFPDEATTKRFYDLESLIREATAARREFIRGPEA